MEAATLFPPRHFWGGCQLGRFGYPHTWPHAKVQFEIRKTGLRKLICLSRLTLSRTSFVEAYLLRISFP